MTAIAFSSIIGPVPVSCLISEKHQSELHITEIPVESGAKITDHAVRMPKKLTLDIASEGAAASFNALKAFQESRAPFSIVTGLTVYSNMLVKRIDAQRDVVFSNILKATIDLQEVIIVGTAYAADPAGDGFERGQPGGANSTSSAAPSAERAKPGVPADRASGTVQRGDAGVSTASPADQSILKGLFGN
ncbi:hypothetical protein IWQ49_006366 [Labrenzia sp. EL_126]|nr:hypothetical protein [Labrenzia sp. EL_126]